MAAAGQIKLTPGEVESWAGQFEAAAGELLQIQGRLDGAVMALQGRWAGLARVHFGSTWPGRRQALGALAQMLSDGSRQLKETARLLADADRDVARRMSQGASTGRPGGPWLEPSRDRFRWTDLFSPLSSPLPDRADLALLGATGYLALAERYAKAEVNRSHQELDELNERNRQRMIQQGRFRASEEEKTFRRSVKATGAGAKEAAERYGRLFRGVGWLGHGVTAVEAGNQARQGDWRGAAVTGAEWAVGVAVTGGCVAMAGGLAAPTLGGSLLLGAGCGAVGSMAGSALGGAVVDAASGAAKAGKKAGRAAKKVARLGKDKVKDLIDRDWNPF